MGSTITVFFGFVDTRQRMGGSTLVVAEMILGNGLIGLVSPSALCKQATTSSTNSVVLDSPPEEGHRKGAKPALVQMSNVSHDVAILPKKSHGLPVIRVEDERIQQMDERGDYRRISLQQ